MLMKIDGVLNGIPSRIINAITLGSEGSSMCGRLWLYHKYVSKNNWLVNLLLFIIDGIETDHCKTAARHWRLRHKKYDCFFPKEYNGYL